MPFQPGNNANPNGARRPRRWQAALDQALARLGNGSIDNGLAKVADKVLQAAMDGDQAAWREVAERMDGKVAQALVNDYDGSPFVITITPTQAKL